MRFFFLASDWDFFFGNWEKRRIIWIGNGAYNRPLVIGGKGPDIPHCWKSQFVAHYPFKTSLKVGNERFEKNYRDVQYL